MSVWGYFQETVSEKKHYMVYEEKKTLVFNSHKKVRQVAGEHPCSICNTCFPSWEQHRQKRRQSLPS